MSTPKGIEPKRYPTKPTPTVSTDSIFEVQSLEKLINLALTGNS